MVHAWQWKVSRLYESGLSRSNRSQSLFQVSKRLVQKDQERSAVRSSSGVRAKESNDIVPYPYLERDPGRLCSPRTKGAWVDSISFYELAGEKEEDWS
ncbi:hypothetical protein HAX54_007692 [Datura stramonium]|uniref:Uncharacterized protein n=1 Tax=Datura stramonium TaxID=4076 RepID=A0ABS8WUS4_DATST|nr:hypothetical protein [Datura stramonium]